MRHPRSTLLLAIQICVATFAASAARAATVLVTYDLSRSSLSITSPVTVSIPPQGTLAGSVQVAFMSNDIGDILDGPASLEAVDLQAVLAISTVLFGNPLTIAGPADVSLLAPVPGVLSGAQLDFGSATGMFSGSGTLTCGGALCSVAGFTSGVPKPFSGTTNVPIPSLTLGSISGNFNNFSIGGFPLAVKFTLDGDEIAREIIPTIPEPGTLLLLTPGLVALSIFGRRRP